MTTNYQTDLGSARAEEQDSSSGAKEQAQQAAGSAAEQGKQVAGTAQEEAARVASEASAQLRGLVQEATSQVEEQTGEQQKRLAGTVRTFADDLESMRSGGESSGLAAQMLDQVTQQAKDLASRLEDKQPRELLDDVRSFARRRPGTFILGAVAAGVIAGRLTRGAKAAQDNPTSGSPSTTTGTSAAPSSTSTSTIDTTTVGTPGPAPVEMQAEATKVAPIPPTDDDASPAYLSDQPAGTTAGPGTGRS